MTDSNMRWARSRRYALHVLTIYFALLFLDFTSSDELFPHWVYTIMKFYTAFWDWFVMWTGKHILHLSYSITIKPNGSGDTTYNYVMQMLWLVLALLIGLAWTVADRRRTHYRGLAYWLRISVRYYFAFMLFVYGFVKVIKLQFPEPSLVRLTDTYGASSPMGLAWTFIGYSKGYNIFTGGAEVLAGCLLFFKRTTLLGAMLAFAIMVNVAAMNFAFDIPVKIFSVNLVFISAYLILYDWERIKRFFFLNAATPAAFLAMPQPTGWKRILQKSLKVLAIFFALYSTFWQSLEAQKKYGDAAPKPPLYGIYNIEKFQRKDSILLPLLTDSTQWRQLIFNYPEVVRVRYITDSTDWMPVEIDTAAHRIVFKSYDDTTLQYNFAYQNLSDNRMILSGSMGGDSAVITMRRYDESHFLLRNRGFHWINERPMNR